MTINEAIGVLEGHANRYYHCGHISLSEDLTQIADVLRETVHKEAEWFDKGSLSCRCSGCGCKHAKESNYCPNCGAKMTA